MRLNQSAYAAGPKKLFIMSMSIVCQFLQERCSGDGLVGRIVLECIKHWVGRNFSVGATMQAEELLGSKVWVKSDQFKSVPGVISSVQTSVDHEDLKSSIAESTFKVSLSSGDVVEVPGTEFASIDHDGLRN
jgi:hypothetical protein